MKFGSYRESHSESRAGVCPFKGGTGLGGIAYVGSGFSSFNVVRELAFECDDELEAGYGTPDMCEYL